MFLSSATTREYTGDSENPFRVTFYKFFPEGRLLTRREYADCRPPELDELRGDVSANWEAVPAFGHYEGVTRLDRGGMIPGLPRSMPSGP
jgi:hypothetical protein